MSAKRQREDSQTMKEPPSKWAVSSTTRTPNSLASQIAIRTSWNNKTNVIIDGEESDIDIYDEKRNQRVYTCLSSCLGL